MLHLHQAIFSLSDDAPIKILQFKIPSKVNDHVPTLLTIFARCERHNHLTSIRATVIECGIATIIGLRFREHYPF